MKCLVGELLLLHPSANSQNLAKYLDEATHSSVGDDYGKIFFSLFNDRRSIDKL